MTGLVVESNWQFGQLSSITLHCKYSPPPPNRNSFSATKKKMIKFSPEQLHFKNESWPGCKIQSGIISNKKFETSIFLSRPRTEISLSRPIFAETGFLKSPISENCWKEVVGTYKLPCSCKPSTKPLENKSIISGLLPVKIDRTYSLIYGTYDPFVLFPCSFNKG